MNRRKANCILKTHSPANHSSGKTSNDVENKTKGFPILTKRYFYQSFEKVYHSLQTADQNFFSNNAILQRKEKVEDLLGEMDKLVRNFVLALH